MLQTDYELLVLVPGLVNEAAAELSLECIAALQPRSARITVVDWSHDIHPDLLQARGRNRHGLARRTSPCLDDLLEVADEVWSENLIPHKRLDPVGPPMWCCQCKAKAWAMGECRRRGIPRLLYMQFGDRMSPSAPRALLETLAANPAASFAFLQVYRCTWGGELATPTQYVHQHQRVGELTAKHKFAPGMMMAVDRLKDITLLDDRRDWPNQPDDLLARQILLANGHGIGVPRSESEHLYYYHADPNPMGDLIKGQCKRARATASDERQAGLALLAAVAKESAASHEKLLARLGVNDRQVLRQRRLDRRKGG